MFGPVRPMLAESCRYLVRDFGAAGLGQNWGRLPPNSAEFAQSSPASGPHFAESGQIRSKSIQLWSKSGLSRPARRHLPNIALFLEMPLAHDPADAIPTLANLYTPCGLALYASNFALVSTPTSQSKLAHTRTTSLEIPTGGINGSIILTADAIMYNFGYPCSVPDACFLASQDLHSATYQRNGDALAMAQHTSVDLGRS